MWKPRLIEGARTKDLGTVEALESDVRSGRAARGDRLPGLGSGARRARG